MDLREFTSTDRSFFASLATDQRVVRFVGAGCPWSPEKIDERVRLALQSDPVSTSETVHWFIAEENGQHVGLFVATRYEDGAAVCAVSVSALHCPTEENSTSPLWQC